eukprot:COSAG04_NODE_284_length_18146_cov_3.266789_6_plen_79_part_00
MPPQPLPLPLPVLLLPVLRRRLAFRRARLPPRRLRSDEGLEVRLFGLQLGNARLRPRTSLSDGIVATTSKEKKEQEDQ